MPTEIIQGQSASNLIHEYYTSWKILKKEALGSNSIKTPAFSPIPQSDVTFYLELWYEAKGSKEDRITFFKILFARSSGVNVPQSMKMMNVIITTSDSYGSAFKKYEHSKVDVEKLNSMIITSEMFKHKEFNRTTGRYEKTEFMEDGMGSSHNLMIECRLVFYETSVSSTDYFRDMCLLKNLKDFVNDFNCVYNQSHLSDIEFKIGNESLPAHKCILAAHSRVFLKMVSDDFIESKTNSIVIKDFSVEIFNSFLEYFYSGEIVDKTFPVVKELYVLADKYDVRVLKRECVETIVSILTVDNVCEILRMSYDYGDEYLKREATAFTVKHFLEISCKDEWKELVDSNITIGYDVMTFFAPKPITE